MSRAPAIVALVAALALSPPAPAVTAHGSVTASVGSGFDSNPTRTVGTEASADGYLGLTASGQGRLTLGDSQQLSGRYDIGLRKYLQTAPEDLAVQQAELEWSMQVGRALLGADGSGKWRVARSGIRDYADAIAELFFDWAFAKELSARLAAGARGYVYPPDGDYSHAGPQAAVSARWQPSRRHLVTLRLFGALPYYRGKARLVEATEDLSGVGRRDRQMGAQLSYALRGPVALQVGYAFVRVDSNSYGEASERHRLWGAAGIKLPLRLFASVQAAWQLLRYPDGIFFSESLLLLDDESQSSAGLKLAWAATERIDLEVRYAAYWIALPKVHDPSDSAVEVAGSTWWRHTGHLAVTFRW
ncbi:MAG: hypothetical protein HY901_03885 [Deltaproteobacteria bacterium]|nr:hypothetical protein [Deltaproteobacteria bacterium]